MKKIKQIVVAAVLMTGFIAVAAPVAVQAVTVCPPGSTGVVCDDQDAEAGELVRTIVNILLFIVGIIAVIMIIVGGIMYTTSGGESGGVTKAKNTILYSVIGLVVAILAYAIVNFVIARLT